MSLKILLTVEKPVLWLILPITGLLVILQVFGENTFPLLRYENTMVASGEWWRFLSGHFIHLGWAHLVLNLIGLWALALIFHSIVSPFLLFFSIALLAVGISLGLFMFNPEVIWYVGLSGVLHGLIVIGALTSYQYRPVLALVLLTGIVAKLLWEQYFPQVFSIELTIGGRVIYGAHIYGTVIAAIITSSYMLIYKIYHHPVEEYPDR